MPQAPEFLIHPTVWLTTMVMVVAFLLGRGVQSGGDPSFSPLLLPSYPCLKGFYFDSLIQNLAVYLIHTERKKGVRASGVLFGYWLLCSLFPATSIIQGVSGDLGDLGSKLSSLPTYSLLGHRPQVKEGQQSALPPMTYPSSQMLLACYLTTRRVDRIVLNTCGTLGI